jgi:hypothetical protein
MERIFRAVAGGLRFVTALAEYGETRAHRGSFSPRRAQ